jgi:starch-binding outer membrane protein, SusD/RagB family
MMESTMHTWTRGALCALLVGTLAGCGDDFLTGPGLTTDPNAPSEATRDQLLVSVQLRQFVSHTGALARVAGMWTQQFAGVGNQTVSWDQYQLTEADIQSWPNFYGGGGLIDLREIQAQSEAAGDRAYLGVAKVWEAFTIGTAASIWGDIPYREAVNPAIDKPVLDPQAQVYADIQALLDSAIGDLQAGTAGGALRFNDLVYEGNLAQWIQAAYTLKARYYIHWAAVQAKPEANTACGGNCAQQALAAAQNGISVPANNFRTFHTSAGGHENIWFQWERERNNQLRAGGFFVNLLQSRNDPRVTEYFAPVGGQVVGGVPATPAPGLSWLSATRAANNFRQPLITYAENQLIMAEANYRLNQPGAALANLNNARAGSGLPALGGLAGQALFNEIAIEKYIALFQNIEVWPEFRRNCAPLAYGFQFVGNRRVPGRLFYQSAERNNNPNIRPPAEQQQRNDNDPAICTANVIGEA